MDSLNSHAFAYIRSLAPQALLSTNIRPGCVFWVKFVYLLTLPVNKFRIMVKSVKWEKNKKRHPCRSIFILVNIDSFFLTLNELFLVHSYAPINKSPVWISRQCKAVCMRYNHNFHYLIQRNQPNKSLFMTFA